MEKINSSPERYTFQKERYIKRCEEKGKKPSEDYLEMYKTWREQEAEKIVDPDWQKDNMEYDLRSTQWICDKVKQSDSYAQNLYASMCNRDFIKNDVWPILTEETWSCSWRHAGGIIADMQEKGDYIDWYCSGIMEEGHEIPGFVTEGTVTDEIEQDLLKLGWLVCPEDAK